jgi:hypothetical protein
MKKEPDILEVEEKIIKSLDKLDKLFDDYEKLCNKQNETFDPINWIKKKFLFLKEKNKKLPRNYSG